MILKRLLKIFIFINIFINFSSGVLAIEPRDYVQLTVNRASEALTEDYTKEEKIQKLKSIASTSVDIKGIAFYTLGTHRKNLTKPQRQEYIVLFEEYFLKTFASRLAEYTDPKITVDSQKILSENYTMVFSTLVSTNKRPEIKIDWRIYTKDLDNLLIRDLIIEGLSLARTLKEEFNSIIQSSNGDINSLFLSLTEFNNK